MLVLSLFSLFSLLSFNNAYFSQTHNYLGHKLSIEIQNNTSLYNKLVNYINVKDLGYMSSWADRIKNGNNYKWAKHHHYIDLPGDQCQKKITKNYIYNLCKNDCIYTSFLNMTNDLKYNKNYVRNITEHLYFLIHFFQDFHQPMHIYGDYRGGNDMYIILNYFNKSLKTNVHSLWDKYIPEYYIKNTKAIKTTLDTLDTTKLKDITDFEKYMLSHLQKLFDIACNVTTIFKTSNKIIFTEYYNENIIRQLFEYYFTFSINVLQFIFL